MYTQCPDCTSIFEISPEHLGAAGGMVRCGVCDSTFNALRRLTQQPPDSHSAQEQAPPHVPSESAGGPDDRNNSTAGQTADLFSDAVDDSSRFASADFRASGPAESDDSTTLDEGATTPSAESTNVEPEDPPEEASQTDTDSDRGYDHKDASDFATTTESDSEDSLATQDSNTADSEHDTSPATPPSDSSDEHEQEQAHTDGVPDSLNASQPPVDETLVEADAETHENRADDHGVQPDTDGDAEIEADAETEAEAEAETETETDENPVDDRDAQSDTDGDAPEIDDLIDADNDILNPDDLFGSSQVLEEWDIEEGEQDLEALLADESFLEHDRDSNDESEADPSENSDHRKDEPDTVPAAHTADEDLESDFAEVAESHADSEAKSDVESDHDDQADLESTDDELPQFYADLDEEFDDDLDGVLDQDLEYQLEQELEQALHDELEEEHSSPEESMDSEDDDNASKDHTTDEQQPDDQDQDRADADDLDTERSEHEPSTEDDDADSVEDPIDEETDEQANSDPRHHELGEESSDPSLKDDESISRETDHMANEPSDDDQSSERSESTDEAPSEDQEELTDTDETDTAVVEPAIAAEQAHVEDQTSTELLTEGVDGTFDEPYDDDAEDLKDLGDYLTPTKSLGRRFAEGSVVALLLGALGGQYVHYNRASLATHPTHGGRVQALYEKLGVELQADWDVNDYRVARHTIVPDEDDNVLRARATVVNNTDHERPLPLVRLQLNNRWGDAIYGEVFTPQQYLQGTPPALLAGQGRLDVTLDLVHPAPGEEIGYSFDICLDSTDGPDCGLTQVFTE